MPQQMWLYPLPWSAKKEAYNDPRTKKDENEVIKPSFKISLMPPYSSSSTFWNELL